MWARPKGKDRSPATRRQPTHFSKGGNWTVLKADLEVGVIPKGEEPYAPPKLAIGVEDDDNCLKAPGINCNHSACNRNEQQPPRVSTYAKVKTIAQKKLFLDLLSAPFPSFGCLNMTEITKTIILGGTCGRRARPGRPPVGQCGGGGGGREGGSDLLALVCAPAFPRPASEWAAPFAPSWAPPFRGRSVAGNAGACGRFTGGAWRAAALAAAAVSPPPPGCSGLPVGVRGRCLSGRPPSALGPGGGGGEGGALWSPDAAPRRPRGGGLAVPAPGGQPSAGGAHPSPAPLYPVRAGPSCRPSVGPPAPPAVVARRWLAGGGREGQRSAVSGLRGSGLPLALIVPALPPTGGGARLSVALYRGGGVGRGARLRRGGRPAALSPPHSLAPIVWAVTCVAACVGVGAAAVADFAGGSASG